MSLLPVQLESLKPGIKYYFLTNLYPDNVVEGIFRNIIPASPTNSETAQYIFENCIIYDQKENKKKLGLYNFAVPSNYPNHIFLIDYKKLPEDINRNINTFGGKIRKSKQNVKTERRLRKSRNRYTIKKIKRRKTIKGGKYNHIFNNITLEYPYREQQFSIY